MAVINAPANGGLGGAPINVPGMGGTPGGQTVMPKTPAPKPYRGGGQGLRGGHGAFGDPGVLGPGTAGGPLAPKPNGLADFANSPLGQYMSQHAQPANAQNYMNAFQGALGTARGDIAQQLAGALSDIKANQGYAQQALGQLPGQINQAYGTADALMGAGNRAAQQGMSAPGLNAGTGANTGGSLAQYMAPTQAAIAGEKAGEMANVPLLNTGIQQAASQQSAAANNAALSDYAQLAQQQAQMAGQAQIAAMGQQNTAAQQQQQNIFAMLQGAQNNQYTLGQIKAQGNGGNTGYGSTQQQQQVVQSPQYAQAVQGVQGGQYKSLGDLQKAYPTNPALWQLVASQYGLK